MVRSSGGALACVSSRRPLLPLTRASPDQPWSNPGGLTLISARRSAARPPVGGFGSRWARSHCASEHDRTRICARPPARPHPLTPSAHAHTRRCRWAPRARTHANTHAQSRARTHAQSRARTHARAQVPVGTTRTHARTHAHARARRCRWARSCGTRRRARSSPTCPWRARSAPSLAKSCTLFGRTCYVGRGGGGGWQRAVAARGGRGGRGNLALKTDLNTVPEMAELGEKGQADPPPAEPPTRRPDRYFTPLTPNFPPFPSSPPSPSPPPPRTTLLVHHDTRT